MHIHPCSLLALIRCTIPLPFLCLPCAQYPFTSLHSLIHHLLTFPPMPCIITLVPFMHQISCTHFMHHYTHYPSLPCTTLVFFIISDFMHQYIESLHSIAAHSLSPSPIRFHTTFTSTTCTHWCTIHHIWNPMPCIMSFAPPLTHLCTIPPPFPFSTMCTIIHVP